MVSSTVEKRLLKLEEKMGMLRDNTVNVSNLTEQLVLSLTTESHERELAFSSITSDLKGVKKSLHESLKHEINTICSATDERFETMKSEAQRAIDLTTGAVDRQKKWMEDEMRSQKTFNDKISAAQTEISLKIRAEKEIAQSTAQEVASLQQSVARDGKNHVEATKKLRDTVHNLDNQLCEEHSVRSKEVQEVLRDNTAIRKRIDNISERIVHEEQKRSDSNAAIVNRIEEVHQLVQQWTVTAQVSEKGTRIEFAQAQEKLKHTIHDAMRAFQVDMEKAEKTVGAISLDLDASRKEIEALQDTTAAVREIRSEMEILRETNSSGIASLTQTLQQQVDTEISAVRTDLCDAILAMQGGQEDAQRARTAFQEQLIRDREALVALDRLQAQDISNAKSQIAEEMDALRTSIGDDMSAWDKTVRERHNKLDATAQGLTERLDELKADVKIVAALVEHSIGDQDFEETVSTLRSSLRSDVSKVADELQLLATAHKDIASTFSNQQGVVAKLTQEQETAVRKLRTLHQEMHDASAERTTHDGEQKKNLQGLSDQLKALQSNVTLQIVPSLAQCNSQLDASGKERKSTLNEIACLRDELNEHKVANRRSLQECETSITECSRTVDALAEGEDHAAVLKKLASLGTLIHSNRADIDMFRSSEWDALRNEMQKYDQTQGEWSALVRRLEAEMKRLRDTVQHGGETHNRWDESKLAFVTKELADARRDGFGSMSTPVQIR